MLLLYLKDLNGYAGWRESNGQNYLYVEADDYYSLGFLEGKYLTSQIYIDCFPDLLGSAVADADARNDRNGVIIIWLFRRKF